MPLDQPVFFLDRNLGKHRFAEVLRKAGLRVEVHDAHFAPNTADPDWLRVVGEQGWIVLTKDRKIRYRPLEWLSILQNGVRAFAFTTGSLKAETMAALFLRCKDQVFRLLEENRKPFIAKIGQSGEVRIWKLSD